MGYLSIALMILSFPIGTIDCGKATNPYDTMRFRDVAQALNHMYENLPAQISIDEKCKRYAVLSFMALSERLPYRKTVLDVISMDEDELNKQYDEMHVNSVIYVFCSAIDRYRITQLAPAFVDVVECLGRIGVPEVRTFLNNKELVLVVDLYKQVLGLPGAYIDVDKLDLTQFSPAFRSRFGSLFPEYSDRFSPSSATIPEDHISFQPQAEPPAENRHLIQRRERSRLDKQRLKILNPKGICKYKEERRRLANRREQSILPQPSDTPEVVKIKLRARERREKANERRRSRRRELREILHQEELDLSKEGEGPKGACILYRTGRFKDIAQAVNFLRENLPANLSIEEKCKRYAVFSDMALSVKFPHKQAVLNVARMGVDISNEHYDRLGEDRVSYSYMGVLDRYRVTQLAPAFIDVVECLRRIDTPRARDYVNHQEVVTIEDLYRQVLDLPVGRINVKNLDLTQFGPAFRSSLEHLFGRYFEVFKQDPSKQQQVEDEQSRRLEHARQRRERSRLMGLRYRIMDPEGMRKRENSRRRSLKARELTLLSQASDTPEMVEVKRRLQERRARANERLRLRRRQLREKQHRPRAVHVPLIPAPDEES